ncbi:phage tail tube protein [Oceanobacillus alkalisoli]|uniref:phage tail tube protein n=1 Tax=Oceanobacillus alkalisoli TaxID=2925113 RepID=UPI001EEFD3BB|nr:phage tail protein [Oceanobacillus alkalisoli]MCF3942211.1 phage tail protein [Oceanobacillus alkalisoli]MCG5104450.1 phage tail protein [Oceanobacillus alkalisoli]
MARNKNALRGHFIQEYTPGQDEPGEEWLELAHYISNIAMEPNETTEEEAFYDGDGTLEETVTGVARAYSPEGHFDPEDPAQALIESLQDEVGDKRIVWHRVVRSDGKKEWVGPATVLNIIAGAGEASAYETFSCTIRFKEKPKEIDLDSGGGGSAQTVGVSKVLSADEDNKAVTTSDKK